MKKINRLFFFLLVGAVCLITSCIPTANVISITVNEDSELTFNVGEFKPSEIVIDINYSDNTVKQKKVTSSMITAGLDTIDEVGLHTLEIKYQNVTCEVEIEIVEKATITSIKITDDCNKTFEQNSFDANQLYIAVTYSNGKTIELKVTEEMITSGLDKVNEIGTHTLEITYKTFKCDVIITVVEGPDLDNYIFQKLSNGEGYSITGYNGNKTNVVIPSEYNGLPVVEIGEQAFYENKTIVRVVIPNTVSIIREAAFYKATSLVTVIIPNSVKEIEAYALRNVKVIYLEANEVNNNWNKTWYDEQHAFIHLGVDIESIVLDGEYEYFTQNGELVLSNYYGNSAEITTPSTLNGVDVKVIGGACFKGNKELTKLTIPSGVHTLEKYALSECTNLIELNLPDTLEVIGEYAIRECSALEHITLPKSLREIRGNAFNMCSSLLEMIIPENVTYIGEYVFSWCVKLKKIYIPKSVVTVKVGACYACSDATIYVEHPAEPSTWETGWNMSSRPVKWNYTE